MDYNNPMRVLTLEEKRERVKDLRSIDDVFFEVLAADPEVWVLCEEELNRLYGKYGI